MRLAPLLALLLAVPAAAQRPWEVRIDVPITIPVELPAVPPANPFAATLVSPPAHAVTPLREKFNLTLAVTGAAYVDAAGSARRVVFTHLPLPGLAPALQQAVLETEFTPAKWGGKTTETWLTFALDLSGRIKQGKLSHLVGAPPAAGAPPVPEAAVELAADPRDLALRAVAIERVDQVPSAKRFRARVPSRVWTQPFRLLAEIGPDGRCNRVVFLSCPEGLRDWLLASLGGWSFRPARGEDGPVAAWTELQGEVLVDLAALETDVLRVSRRTSYPLPPADAAAAPAAARPPGV